MKKVLFFLLLVVAHGHNIYAQCTNVPVQEAVRNGDFEAGYLTGAAGKNHSFTPNGPLDFYSDMDFAGSKPNYPTDACKWGIGDKYVVAKAENFSCTGSTFTNNSMWGVTYGGAANFKDHTPSKNGKGYALLVDLNSRTIGLKTGGLPIAWEQKVDVYPSQNYWFSAWVANYGGAGKTTPIMQVVIIPEKSGVVDIANKVTLPVTATITGTMVWTQMSAKWTPVGIYDKVTIRFEFVNVTGGAAGLDVAFDDISFINSCQNLATGNAYTANFNLPDTVNLCSEVGTGITLDPNVPVGQKTNASVYWFYGVSPQTQFATGVWTQTISSVGTYRVCIDDPDNNCSVNDNVVVIEKATVNIPDVELCSPSMLTLDCGITFPTIGIGSVSWNGPSGTGSAKTYSVNKGGSHSVTINSVGGHNCSATDNFTVTSKLPGVPTNLEYCDGGGSAIELSVGDGKIYKWSTSPTMTHLIGTGIKVSWTPAPATTGDQTLWLQSANTTAGGTMPGPILSASASSKTFTTNLVTSQPVLLKSAKMGVDAWTGGCGAAGTSTTNVTVDLLDASNAVLQSKVVAVTCGSASYVNLDITVPVGNFKLRATSTGNLWTTPLWWGTATNFSLPGIISYTGYSAHYGAFGEMVVEKSEACDPVPVLIKAKACCVPPTDNPQIDYGASALSVCAPDKATIVTKTITNGLEYKWQVSHNKGISWKDTLSTGIIAGGKATLNNVDKSAWYRIVVASAGNLTKSCIKNSDSAVVIIKAKPTLVNISVSPNQSSFCGAMPHTLTANATVAGGGSITYQWKYDGNGSSATTAGLTTVGTHNYKVIATANGCVDSSAMKTITIHPLPDSTITPVGQFCSDASTAVTLNGATAGGSWKVDNVALPGNSFVPKNFGIGSHVIEYNVTENGCSSNDTIQFHIIKRDTADIIVAGPFCKNAVAINLKAKNSGGAWSGDGISNGSLGTFNPKNAMVGLNTITYTITGTCGDTKTASIAVNSVDSADVLPAGPFCSSSSSTIIQLENGSSIGGTWSGKNINAITGSFDPSGLSPGIYKLKYTTGGMCKVSDSIDVSISNSVDFNFVNAKTSYCSSETSDTIEVNILGGTFRTASGLGLVNATKGIINPSLMNIGKDTIYYEKAGLCGDTAILPITIHAVDVAALGSYGPYCESDVAQQLVVGPANSAGSWSASCGACISTKGMFDPSVARAGRHRITFTTTGVCSVFDTISVRVMNQMIANITTPNNSSICVDHGLFKIALSNSSTVGGTWSSVPAGYIDNAGNFDPQKAGVANGIWLYYKVSGTTSGCSAKDSVQVNVLSRENAKITDGLSKTFCSYDSPFQLSALNAGGVWTGTGVNPTGLFDPKLAGVGGPYPIKYLLNGATGSCSNEDTIMITVLAPKNAALHLSGPYCENLSVQQLNAVVPGGIFSGKGVSSSGLFNPKDAGVGDHWITYTQNGQCPTSDSIQIKVEAVPEVKLATNSNGGCVPLTVNFADSSTAAAKIATWNFGNGNSKSFSAANSNIDHTFGNKGTYDIWLKVEFQNGCIDSAPTKITVSETPEASFTATPNVVNTLDPTVKFINESIGATKYQWSFGTTGTVGSPQSSNNANVSVFFNPQIAEAKAKLNRGMDSIPIKLVASNDACSDSTIKMVFIKDIFTLYVPNAFTPNLDGTNDEFFPDGLNHSCNDCNNYEFSIFNRWGELIFRSTTPYEGWNGRKQNSLEEAQIDVYVWRLTYTNFYNGKEDVKLGTVSLIK